MLLYHFGSARGCSPRSWRRSRLSNGPRWPRSPGARTRGRSCSASGRAHQAGARPFIRLFFEVFGLVAQGAPGTEGLRESLTRPWLTDAAEVAEQLGLASEPSDVRAGIAVTRGLLLDLVAGAAHRGGCRVPALRRPLRARQREGDDGQVSGRVAPK